MFYHLFVILTLSHGASFFKYNRESSLPLEVLRERELKWIKMTKNWDMWMKKNHPKVGWLLGILRLKTTIFVSKRKTQFQVKERCRKGIPPAVRGLVWQNLCGANKLKEDNHGVFAVCFFNMKHDLLTPTCTFCFNFFTCCVYNQEWLYIVYLYLHLVHIGYGDMFCSCSCEHNNIYFEYWYCDDYYRIWSLCLRNGSKLLSKI